MCVDLIVDLGKVIPQYGQVEQWIPDYSLEMGGSCCIFACQAAKLGLRVAILGRVGDDAFGQLVLRRLRQSGVDLRYASVDSCLKTGLGIALSRVGGDRAILTYGGSLNAVYPEDISDRFLRSGKHLHYGSYYLQTNLLPMAPQIMLRAKALGLTVSLDTNWDPGECWDGGLRACLECTDVLLLNGREAQAITSARDHREAMKMLLESVPTVVIKRGEKGALVGREGECHAVSVEPVTKIVDTIGAGDSFDAGFLAGWLRGLDLRDCAAIGNMCGRATTQVAGGIAGQLAAVDIERLR